MNTVERALELARRGECRSITELEKQLRREGYSAVADHLAGYGIRKQLRGLVAKAAETEAAPS